MPFTHRHTQSKTGKWSKSDKSYFLFHLPHQTVIKFRKNCHMKIAWKFSELKIFKMFITTKFLKNEKKKSNLFQIYFLV